MTQMRVPPMHIPYDPSRQDACDPTDYQKTENIGAGSYGTVHKAVRTRPSAEPGKYYAIKTHKNISSYAGDQIRFRFINELLMLSSGALLGGRKSGRSLSPFVVQMEDWYQEDGKVYIVMDYCPTDLHTVMNKFLLNKSDIQFYLAQIILGLESVHASKIVHNDLKPENILIDSNGNVKITDFGISELCQDGEKKRGQYGTQIYMAPETLTFRGHDQTADYFSLGVMLYELLQNELPFKGRNTAEIIKSQKKKLKFADHVSPDAKDLIKGLLLRSSHKRAQFVKNIKSHPFFEGINWEKMATGQLEAPFDPISGSWSDENADFAAANQHPRKRSLCKREMFTRLATVFKKKKSDSRSPPVSSVSSPQVGVKSMTGKMARKNPLTSRLLYRSLNRFSSASSRSTECTDQSLRL